MKQRQYYYATLVFLAFSLAVFRVQASTAVYENFQFLSDEFHFNDSFAVTAPGLYEAELFDYQFPAAFDQLSLVITQGNTILGGGFDTSSFTFNISDKDIPLGVHVSGLGPLNDKTGDYETGLYGMRILPIPIPAAAWLFLSGFIGIVTIARPGAVGLVGSDS